MTALAVLVDILDPLEPRYTHRSPKRQTEMEAKAAQLLARIRAVGYDVARIEEGERRVDIDILRLAMDRASRDSAATATNIAFHYDAIVAAGGIDGALAASDEAGHSQECIAAYYTDGGQSGCICGADALAASDEAVRP